MKDNLYFEKKYGQGCRKIGERDSGNNVIII